MTPATKTVCHISFSSIMNASRLMRAADAAAQSDLGVNVICVGYQDGNVAEREILSTNCEIWRIPTIEFGRMPRVATRLLQWLFWNVSVVRRLVGESIDVLQCHSLAAMLPGVILKRFGSRKLRLIYDAHELETERHGWGTVHKAFARLIERAVIPSADHIFLVGDLICEWYRKTYGLSNLSVLRNVPKRPDVAVQRNRILRDEFRIADETLLFLYLGVIDQGRGFQQIIEAFRDLPEHHVVFMGGGRAAAEVEAAAAQAPNIHLRKPVAIQDVIRYAAGCDVGISFIEDTCLSYHYCLPNKLHEYRLAGLPVIVSNLPEMARYIDKTHCGWKVNPDAKSLRALVASLDRKAIDQTLADVRMAPLTWDDEKQEYLVILSKLLEAQ
ncbi:MAG: glycosyltransferase [Alphaproteobacteria bacterium]|nr:glycosyltransferase [Alphaproteobacteria bacterium]